MKPKRPMPRALRRLCVLKKAAPRDVKVTLRLGPHEVEWALEFRQKFHRKPVRITLAEVFAMATTGRKLLEALPTPAELLAETEQLDLMHRDARGRPLSVAEVETYVIQFPRAIKVGGAI